MYCQYFLPSCVAKFPAFWDMPFVSIDALFFIMNAGFYSEHAFKLIEALWSYWTLFPSPFQDFPTSTRHWPCSTRFPPCFSIADDTTWATTRDNQPKSGPSLAYNYHSLG